MRRKVPSPPLPFLIFPHLRSIHEQALSLGLGQGQSVRVRDDLEASCLGNRGVMIPFTDMGTGRGSVRGREYSEVSVRPAESEGSVGLPRTRLAGVGLRD